jgi:hypothetical protein
MLANSPLLVLSFAPFPERQHDDVRGHIEIQEKK